MSRPFQVVLVANRGEIAVRVLRACRELGLVGVAVYSDPDAGAMHVREADRAVAIGGAAVAESYLDQAKLLAAAAEAGAGAVHPGYGLLSEHAGFARAVTAAGLVWVGPPPEAIAQMGDKLAARRAVLAAGVEPVPGTTDPVTDAAEVVAFGEAAGWPVAVKAAAGGGGRGIRVVAGPGEAAAALAAATREAQAAFGDGACYLERFFPRPRHVEVQVLADAHGGIVHLGERDCSVQRRHQKLVEEAPSPAVGPDLRRRLGDAALAVAGAVGYVGAGTVEFLLAGGGFWFLEVNARIQVEHPVTEAVTGLDLVRLQLLVAAGQPLPPEATRAEPRGHAIEARLYAEDPAAGFLPQTGTLHRFEVPGGGVGPRGGPGPGAGGWGVRVDAGVADGSAVGVHYDPLLAKVVAHAPTREEAAQMLAAALSTARLHGVVTNRDLLVGVLRSEPFLSGETDTAFLDRHPPAELTTAGGSPEGAGGARGPGGLSAVRLHAAAAALAAQADRRATATVYPAVPSGWRNNPSQPQRVALEVARPPGPGVSVAYGFDRTGTLEALEVDGDPLPGPRLWACFPDPAHPPGSADGRTTRTWLVDLEVEGIRRRFDVHQVGATFYVDSPLGHAELHEHPQDPEGQPAATPPEGLWTAGSPGPGVGRGSPTGGPADGGSGSATPGAGADGAAADGVTVSPLPGIVRRVAVRVGDRVDAGAVLVVVEAMKTEHRIAAGRAGRVRRVLVAEGQEVAAGTTVAELEEAADG